MEETVINNVSRGCMNFLVTQCLLNFGAAVVTLYMRFRYIAAPGRFLFNSLPLARSYRQKTQHKYMDGCPRRDGCHRCRYTMPTRYSNISRIPLQWRNLHPKLRQTIWAVAEWNWRGGSTHGLLHLGGSAEMDEATGGVERASLQRTCGLSWGPLLLRTYPVHPLLRHRSAPFTDSLVQNSFTDAAAPFTQLCAIATAGPAMAMASLPPWWAAPPEGTTLHPFVRSFYTFCSSMYTSHLWSGRAGI
jgi:hypothetical protein